MPGIFLSYRRDDTEAHAGRLHEALQHRLPGVVVFRDIDNIPAGVKFADYIRNGVAESDALVAVIGPNWASAVDENGTRRLEQASDFVRVEIEAAIEKKIPIVPVLVGGATMPRAASLPPTLAELVEWQNHELPARLWNEGCDRLVETLTPLVSRSPRTAPPDVSGTTTGSRWPAIALVAFAVMLGTAFYFNRGLRSTGTGSSTSVPPVATASASPTSLKTIFPKLALAGTWVIESEKEALVVAQDSSGGRVSRPAMSNAELLLLHINEPFEFVAELNQEPLSLRMVIRMEPKPNGEFAWTLDTPRTDDKAPFLIGFGTASSDLRSWKGQVKDNQGGALEFTAKLEKDDAKLHWDAIINGRVENLIFLKR